LEPRTNNVDLINTSGTVNSQNLPINPSKNILFIFCDDISYSGNQLSRFINDTNIFEPGSLVGQYLKLDSKIKIFLNIVGLLPEAKQLIKKQFQNDKQLIIPTSTIIFSGTITLDDFMKEKATNQSISLENFKKLNDCWILLKTSDSIILESKLTVEYSKSTNRSLIYPFHKYPDGQSTYMNLCYIKTLDNMISLDISKFLSNFSIKPNDFCKNISNQINLKVLLNSFNISDAHQITQNIFDNYNDKQQINLISWLNSCNISSGPNIFSNKSGTWFKSIKNFSSNQDVLDNFNGDCNKNVISPFYKNLLLSYEGIIYNVKSSVVTLLDIYNTHQSRQTHKKYLKYKNKYLEIKNKKN
jgi:hypothetical protein